MSAQCLLEGTLRFGVHLIQTSVSSLRDTDGILNILIFDLVELGPTLVLNRVSTGIDISIQRPDHYFLIKILKSFVLTNFLKGILLDHQ